MAVTRVEVSCDGTRPTGAMTAFAPAAHPRIDPSSSSPMRAVNNLAESSPKPTSRSLATRIARTWPTESLHRLQPRHLPVARLSRRGRASPGTCAAQQTALLCAVAFDHGTDRHGADGYFAEEAFLMTPPRAGAMCCAPRI